MSERRWGNFSSCCRLCLSEKLGTLKSIFEDATLGQDVVVNIQEFVGVDIKPDDKLSTMVCDKCNNQVQIWRKFKNSCFNNQSKLELWVNEWSSNTANDELNISIRIKDEIMDDNENENDQVEDNSDNEVRVKTEPIDPLDPIYHVETEMPPDDYEFPPSLSPALIVAPVLEQFNNARNSREMNGPVTIEREKKEVISDGKKCLMCNKSFSSVANRHRHDAVFHRGTKRKSEPAKELVPDEDFEIEFHDISNRVDNEAATVSFVQLPEKSKDKYEKEYVKFSHWRKLKDAKDVTESLILTYFNEKSKEFKSSSLWVQYSMLKATLQLNENVDIGNFCKVTEFLKHMSVNYQPKKSQVLSRNNINKFLVDAPNETFLMIKVAMIIGVAGACRREELCRMKIEDIEDKQSVLIVRIPHKKNPRTFTLISENDTFNPLAIYRQYVSLRPKHVSHGRFFLSYRRGRCTVQPVGINSFAKFPKIIATYLGLQNPELFTGHCFRRSSVTLSTDLVLKIARPKRHVNWKSESVTEEYIDDSIKFEQEDYE